MAPALKDSKVFKPLKVGLYTLNQRVAHLPLTRFRATDDHTPSQLQLQYYTDRSKAPGTLLVTEGTIVSETLGGFDNVPGIYTDKHVQGWKKITEAVHANKSYISLQLWAVGRGAQPAVLKKENVPLVGVSEVYVDDAAKEAAEAAGTPLKALTTEEIENIIHVQYPKAAKNALEAGFDYLELHGANGYLIEQFLSPHTNRRTDKYGGSTENRARFALEIVDELLKIVPAEKLAIRLSPWNTFQGMKAEEDAVHPIVTYGYLLSELQKKADAGNQLAYVSLVDGRLDLEKPDWKAASAANFFAAQIWKGVILKGGNYGFDEAGWEHVLNDIESSDRLVAGFGRSFLANPDLVPRLKDGLKLNEQDRSSFYGKTSYGYNTYRFYGDDSKAEKKLEEKIAAISLA